MDCSRPFSYVALQTIEKLGLVAEINERNLQKCCNVQNLPKIAKRDVKLEKRRGGLELQNKVDPAKIFGIKNNVLDSMNNFAFRKKKQMPCEFKSIVSPLMHKSRDATCRKRCLDVDRRIKTFYPNAGRLPPPLPYFLQNQVGNFQPVLNLSNWAVDDEIFYEISQYSSLNKKMISLDLSRTEITSFGLQTLHVLQNLEELQLNFCKSLCSKSLEVLAKAILDGGLTNFRSLDIDNCLIGTISERGLFLFCCAVNTNLTHLSMIDAAYLNEKALLAVTKFCLNLVSLNLSGVSVSAYTMRSILTCCRHLKEINCRASSNITSQSFITESAYNGLVLIIQNSLSYVSLHKCISLNSTSIGYLSRGSGFHLLSLDISDCYEVGDGGLQTIGENCFNITRLNISNNSKITNKGIFAIISQLKLLTNLLMSNLRKITNGSLQYIGRSKVLHRMEELDIGNNNNLCGDSLTFLANQANSFQNAMKIFLLNGCKTITRKGILCALTYFSNVRVLDCRDCQIDDKTLGKIAALLCSTLTALKAGYSKNVPCHGDENGPGNNALFVLITICSRLESLTITNCPQISLSFMQEDISFQIPKVQSSLAYLDFSGCDAVNILNLKRFLKLFPNLRHLKIDYCNIATSFMGPISITENRKYVRQEKLVLGWTPAPPSFEAQDVYFFHLRMLHRAATKIQRKWNLYLHLKLLTKTTILLQKHYRGSRAKLFFSNLRKEKKKLLQKASALKIQRFARYCIHRRNIFKCKKKKNKIKMAEKLIYKKWSCRVLENCFGVLRTLWYNGKRIKLFLSRMQKVALKSVWKTWINRIGVLRNGIVASVIRIQCFCRYMIAVRELGLKRLEHKWKMRNSATVKIQQWWRGELTRYFIWKSRIEATCSGVNCKKRSQVSTWFSNWCLVQTIRRNLNKRITSELAIKTNECLRCVDKLEQLRRCATYLPVSEGTNNSGIFPPILHLTENHSSSSGVAKHDGELLLCRIEELSSCVRLLKAETICLNMMAKRTKRRSCFTLSFQSFVARKLCFSVINSVCILTVNK